MLIQRENLWRQSLCLAASHFAKRLTNHQTRMKILRAIGFGVFLIVISIMMPVVLGELSKTIVVFLQSSAQAFAAAGAIAAHATDSL